MTVAAILKHKGFKVFTIGPDAGLRDIAEQLTAHHIGAILVVDPQGKLLGIVSERDIVTSLARNGEAGLTMTSGLLMTRSLRVATPDMTIDEAMRIMSAAGIRHLPVMQQDTILGLISIRDVVLAKIMEQDAARIP